jgi:hypothetical protein
MPDIEELIKKYGKQIVEEMNEYREVLQTRLPRDSARRPWSDAGAEAGAANATSGADSPKVPNKKWYASLHGIKSALVGHRMLLFVVLSGSLMILAALAQFIPSSYNSTLHLYAPEKTDTISSRMALFSNRLEFASFPVDFKIPLGLVARRLRNEPARDWVLKEFGSKPSNSDSHLIPEMVRAETFYAEGSELLVIQGYANDPQLAADITNLYWDYLESEVRNMRLEHLKRIEQWISLTSQNINEKLTEVTSEITRSSAMIVSESRTQLNSMLEKNYAEIEVKRIRAQKEIEELKAASSGGPARKDLIWAVSNPDIQDLRQVELALKAMAMTDEVKFRVADNEKQAYQLVNKLLSEQTVAYGVLTDEARRMKSQIESHPTILSTNEQNERVRQQEEYRSQLVELDRLKNQISVEVNIAPPKLRVIQPALADPTTRRPLLVLKYFVCIAGSFFFTLLALLLAQMKATRALSQEKPRFRGSLGAPQPTGAGA